MKRFNSLEFDDSSNFSHNPTGAEGHGLSGSGAGEPIRDAAYFYEQATKSFLHGDFELTLRNYSRSLEQSTTYFDAWAGQIRMLIELGEYPEALIWSDKAMELFPDNAELLAYKAVACLRDEKMNKAMGFSDNAVSKEKIGPRVWLCRGEVLIKRKSRVAEDCISKAVSLAGESADIIRLDAGRMLRMYGRYTSAQEYLKDAVRDFPKSALAWYELGCCQAKMGFAQAKVSLEQCDNLRPHWIKAETALDAVRNKGFLGFFKRGIFRR